MYNGMPIENFFTSTIIFLIGLFVLFSVEISHNQEMQEMKVNKSTAIGGVSMPQSNAIDPLFQLFGQITQKHFNGLLLKPSEAHKRLKE